MNATEFLTRRLIQIHYQTDLQNLQSSPLASTHRDEITRKKRAYAKVVELIEKYEVVANDKERIEKYNEEKTKKEFIEPLFQALGWDIENRFLHDEVTEEEKISKKRVDYGFRLNGIPKFYLEAKALRENLDNKEFIQQAISYSWHKGCTWAVLTDFKDIKIFNSEVVCPDYSQNRFVEMSCMELREQSRFDELWDFLSKEGFEHGKLDQIAEKWGKKRKRISVDKQLLEDFMYFRKILSDDIVKLNKRLSEKDVDEAVQKILDRLVFIRSCEDKELEETQLWAIRAERKEKQKIRRLRQAFSYYAKRYNSKIFAESLCDKVDADNLILDKIIEGLYWTKDKTEKYDFSFIEADVLGSIYEQYLGHILKKAEDDTKLIDGSSHRKEMGVYYTPTYIVDYIVKNTLGKLLENKKIKREKIKVLDPACGSGSFLTKAYDSFIKYDKGLAQTRLDLGGEDIKYAKKLSILENNIYGVDLDNQAIEITNLDLFLKIATRGKKLPQLPNVKQGNSLIDDQKIAGDLAFKWKKEFSTIMKKGGFDVIIGNPPYVSNWTLSKNERAEVEYLNEKFSEVTMGHWDLYIIFITQSLSLLKDGGFLSFIVPSSFFKEKYGKKLRELIVKNYSLIALVEFGTEQVFNDVARQYNIFVVQNKFNPNNVTKIVKYEKNHFQETGSIGQKEFLNFHNCTFRTDLKQIDLEVMKKVSTDTILLGSICCINVGVVAHSKEGSPISFTKDDVIHSSPSKGYKKYLGGKEISRYNIHWEGKFMDYENKVQYFHRPKFPQLFERNKIIVRRISGENNRIIMVYDENQFYTNDNLIHMVLWDDQINNLQSSGQFKIYKKCEELSLLYLTGIVGSKLISYIFSKFFGTSTLQGTYTGIYPEDLRKIPIKISDNNIQENMVALVKEMLSFNKRLVEIGDKKTDERSRIEEKIRKIDDEIDKMVYRIYNITENEIKIIENSLK